MIPSPRAGNVKQVAFGVINLAPIRIVSHRFNPLLQRKDFVVARHYRHGAELQTLCKVHGADGDMSSSRLDVLIEDKKAATVRSEVSRLVVQTLLKIGRLYYHADVRDFETSMFFSAHSKRLERIRSDAFGAWLSDWIGINRAETLSRSVLAAIETASLTAEHSTGLVPELYWAGHDGRIYLSIGDGQIVRVSGGGVDLLDTGTDGVLFPAA
jgi:hypothetical protein